MTGLIAEITAGACRGRRGETARAAKPARRFQGLPIQDAQELEPAAPGVVGKAEWMIPSTAESEEARQSPGARRNPSGSATSTWRHWKAGPIPRFVVTSLQADQYQPRRASTRSSIAPAARWKIASRNVSLICSLDDRNLPPTPMRAKPVCGFWLSSMALCPYQRAAARHRPWPRPASPTLHAAPSGLKLLKDWRPGSHQRSAGSSSRWHRAFSLQPMSFETAWAELDQARPL